ncbi:hypothetical protein GpartN1_g6137.t1 [Galdieria partita]|uniref:Uncharacterized protein n=1 Tax=Galdieria partita TaxID=83374 RepID=A0A9C7Q138_9RHOD|nr:hypothetical protein GpartN1_g6137.t1 [Galdieria partita]
MDLAVTPILNNESDCSASTTTKNSVARTLEEPNDDVIDSFWDWHIFRRILHLGSGLFGFEVPGSTQDSMETQKRTENRKYKYRNAATKQDNNGQVECEEGYNSQHYATVTNTSVENRDGLEGNKVENEPTSVIPIQVAKSRGRRSFSLPTNVADLTKSNSTQSFWSFWKRKHRCLSCIKRIQGTEGIPKNLLSIAVTQDDEVVTTQMRKAAKAMNAEQTTPLDTLLQTSESNDVALVASEGETTDFGYLSTYSQRGITLFLLDWDDTLFASTFLSSFDSVELLSTEERDNLSKLELIVMIFLNALNARGHIAIVTNADAYWVEMTCQRFMPKVYSYMQEFQVLVVSARNLFGSDSRAPISSCPSDWKAAAFLKLMIYFFSSTATDKKEILQLSHGSSEDTEQTADIPGSIIKEGKPPLYMKYSLSRLCTHRSWTKAIHALDIFHRRRKKKEKQSSNIVISQVYTDNWKFEKAVLVDKDSFACHHIIVMGDACFEHNAVNTLRAQYPQAHFKFIQFISEPTMADLSQQLKSVYGALDEIGNFAGNLDVRLKPQ